MLRTTTTCLKMRSIPILGADASKSIYQITDYVQRNPFRSFLMGCGTVVGLVYYDARVRHRDRVVSPNIKNNLEYDTYDIRDAKERERITSFVPASDAAAAAANATSAGSSAAAPMSAHDTLTSNLHKIAMQEKDPFVRAEMLRAIERETSDMNRAQSATMMVTSDQLNKREPHWNVRNNERNWSVMARDQQKQKDSYVYRLDRSRDDDFGRNSSK